MGDSPYLDLQTPPHHPRPLALNPQSQLRELGIRSWRLKVQLLPSCVCGLHGRLGSTFLTQPPFMGSSFSQTNPIFRLCSSFSAAVIQSSKHPHFPSLAESGLAQTNFLAFTRVPGLHPAGKHFHLPELKTSFSHKPFLIWIVSVCVSIPFLVQGVCP